MNLKQQFEKETGNNDNLLLRTEAYENQYLKWLEGKAKEANALTKVNNDIRFYLEQGFGMYFTRTNCHGLPIAKYTEQLFFWKKVKRFLTKK